LGRNASGASGDATELNDPARHNGNSRAAELCYIGWFDRLYHIREIQSRETAFSETFNTTMSASNQQDKQSPERQIVDEAGTAWRVTEMRVWDANGRPASSLIAAHERGFRRLWNFPENWAELADLQLAELIKPSRKAAPPAASS